MRRPRSMTSNCRNCLFNSPINKIAIISPECGMIVLEREFAIQEAESMRTVLKISGILSWCNLIVWGIIPCMGVLAALMAGNPLVLVLYFIMGATALHSFAALKLHTSIRNPAIPLSNQTPAGI